MNYSLWSIFAVAVTGVALGVVVGNLAVFAVSSVVARRSTRRERKRAKAEFSRATLRQTEPVKHRRPGWS